MRTRIIGLGNTILSDDGVGIYAVREVARRLNGSGQAAQVEILETEVGGFALMELMAGCEHAILLDSLQFDNLEAGTVLQLDPLDLRTSLRLRSVHEIDLPTALELGRRMGMPMPRQVSIIGIQAHDAYTFGYDLSAPAQRGMLEAVDLVLAKLSGSAVP
jgi:hydrogenase maturation protease